MLKVFQRKKMRKGAVIQGIVDVPDSGGGQDYKDFARLHELFSNQYVKFSFISSLWTGSLSALLISALCSTWEKCPVAYFDYVRRNWNESCCWFCTCHFWCSGDYELTMDGIHENILQMRYHDASLQKTVWLFLSNHCPFYHSFLPKYDMFTIT